MICLLSTSTNPYFNLATEEYLLKNRSEDICFLYINTPVIVVGKHQNAVSEANMAFSMEHNVPVLRRISGGGAVYHDEGNLNFCFITNGKQGELVDFRRYTQPVVQFLATLGLEVEYSGSNNLTVNGKKISGNAMHVYKNRVLHHGTLLFNTNLDNLVQSLKPVNPVYSDKSVKSKPWAVANISQLASLDFNIQTFANRFLYFLIDEQSAKPASLSVTEMLEISSLSLHKYEIWEWTYGYFTEYYLEKQIELPGDTVYLRLKVVKGEIGAVEAVTNNNNSLISSAFSSILQNSRHCPVQLYSKFRQSPRFLNLTDKEIQNIVKQLF